MWDKTLLRAKGRALLIHLGISAVLLLPFIYLIVVRWFPGPLFHTDGGWQGLRIMLFVDLCIGPALTLLVYNPAKSLRALRFDFGFIAAVQIVALAYGYVNVSSKRPVVLAHFEGGFTAVTWDDLQKQEIAPEAWARLGDDAPYWVHVRPPRDREETGGIIAYSLAEGLPESSLFFLYEPLREHLGPLQASALDMPAQAARNPALAADYEAFAKRHADRDLRYYRLDGYFNPAIIALDAHGHYVGALYHEAPRK